MDNINFLISLLKQEIASLQQLISENKEETQRLNDLLELLNEKNIFKIKRQEVDYIKETIKLGETELKLIDGIINSNGAVKEYLKKVGLDKNQQAILLNIKRKMEVAIGNLERNEQSEYDKKIEKYEQIISDLENKKIISDLDLIKDILIKYNASLEEQIEIILALSTFNIENYNNMKNSILEKPLIEDLSEDQIIDEDSLKETNLQRDGIERLFSSFNLSLDDIYDSSSSIYLQKLLKYGDNSNIDGILEYMTSDARLKYIFKLPEILTNILLHSSVEKIKEVIKVSEENGIREILKRFPTIFYPAVKEKKRMGMPSPNNFISGSMNHFIGNVNLLKEINISVPDAYKKCSTFFIKGTKRSRKIINFLKLYNIDLTSSNSVTLSVLRNFKTVSKNIDISIESGCYQYSIQNLSRLINYDVNFYGIKYARKQHNSTNELGTFSPYRVYKNGNTKLSLRGEFSNKNSVYGKTAQETFELYGAVRPKIEDEEEFDNIIEANDNNGITEKSLNDEFIKQLDELYMDESSIIYNFDGVIISRIKVLRYYETLISNLNIKSYRDAITYAICINSMLDSNELEKINNCLDKVKFIRGNIK